MMKRELSVVAAVLLMLTVLFVPLGGGFAASADATPTTVAYETTTTSDWNLCSTNTTWPPTTVNLAGPDGINPDYTTTTTAAPSVCGNSKDLLSDADITVSDTMAILGHPAGGNWLSVDCYSYDGGTISIVPTGSSSIHYNTRYLHITIIANVPFTLSMTEEMTTLDGADWVGTEDINDDGMIKAGAYVISAHVDSVFEYANYVHDVTVTLTAPGSVTVGHIALSDQEICGENTPKIQTTTRPSFPWDDTTILPGTTTTTLNLTGPDGTNTTTAYPPTTTTTWVLTGATTTYPPTTTTTWVYTDSPPIVTTTQTDVTSTTAPITNPTVGDTLLPGDADGDGSVSSSDARIILQYCLDEASISGDLLVLADYDGDGKITTADTREILIMLIL